MEIVAKKTIGFSLNEQESSQLKKYLGNIGIDYSDLTAKETILVLAKKATEAINALIDDNQKVNEALIAELREENQSLINLNQELTEKHQELTGNNSELISNNQELISDNLVLKNAKDELFKEIENLKNNPPETKEIKVPVELNPFQIIVELNHFQLRLAAQVANNHLVESTYNELAQEKPIAFCRIEGKPKERVGQLLKNIFIGVQFNYHSGAGFVPDSPLSSSDLRKAFQYHKENTEEEE